MKVPLDPSYRSILVVETTVYSAGEEVRTKLVAAVDTGASSFVIRPQVARSLGYPAETAPVERVVAGSSVFYAPKIVLARVDVGAASATDVDAISHDLPEESLVDALVGLSFLTSFQVSFDFESWEMDLSPRA